MENYTNLILSYILIVKQKKYSVMKFHALFSCHVRHILTQFDDFSCNW